MGRYLTSSCHAEPCHPLCALQEQQCPRTARSQELGQRLRQKQTQQLIKAHLRLL